MECITCGEIISPHIGRGRPRIYCSLECRASYRSSAGRARVVELMTSRECAACGASLSERTDTKTRFCDQMCAKTYRNTVRREARRSKYGPVTCKRCNIAMPPARRLGALYCSEACKRLTLGDRWRAKAPHYMRLYNYGLTVGAFEALMLTQDGRCAICGTDDFSPKRYPCVDHDHASGAVRGLLCGNCNHGVGKFKDNPALLRAAADYVEAARAS